MRVYGSSPLFNYVELIFRSKRLFLASIFLATLATVGFYYSRTKTYTATMVVMMTGQKTMGATDETQRGTVAWKLSILNIVYRRSAYIQEAMKAGGLLQGKSDIEVSQYCKKVADAITYDPSGNLLGLTCRWAGSGSECENILTAFYRYYTDKVFNEERVVSLNRRTLLEALYKDYQKKHHDLDVQVSNYQISRLAFKAGYDFDQANREYLQRKAELARMSDQMQSAKKQRDSIAAELAKTKPTIQDSIKYKGPTEAPEKATAITARDAALQTLNDLRLKYSDAHPLVKAAQEKADTTQARVAELEKQDKLKATQKPGPGDIQSITENSNPQYQQLKSNLTDQNLRIASLETDYTNASNALEAVKQRVQVSPAEALSYKAMTADMGLYAQMEEQLRADLERARLEEQREKDLNASEMTVEVPPTAEMEQGGARSALMLGAGPILGLIIAFAFSLLAESLDHSLRTPQEVETFLNKPVLAVLPRLDTNKKTARRQLGSGDNNNNNRPSLPS